MKKCSACKTLKHLTEFNVNRARKDGYQSRCRDCGKDHAKTYYQTNKAVMIPAIKEANNRRVRENYTKIHTYLLNHPCVDCGEGDPIVLDFDHVLGDKKNHVSRMTSMGNSWRVLETEIAKCEVRCANCHRRKTAKQLGHFRATLTMHSGFVQRQDSGF